MKKVLLTAAIACALSPAFAQAPKDVATGHLPFQIDDYYELNPYGDFPPDNLTMIFLNPQMMLEGLDIPPVTFKVTASRSWTVQYKATDFERQAPEVLGIDQFLPVSSIMTVYTTSTDPLVNNLYTSASQLTVVDALQDLVKGWGGVDRPYSITGKITPGNLIGTHNMEGIYQTDVMHVLSLD